jgi:hypothetical protein
VDITTTFDNTDIEYMESSLQQRNPGPKSAGSTFSSLVTFDDLKFADWQPSKDPAIKSPALGYTAAIPGLLGIAKLDTLSLNKKVVLQPAHKGKAKIKEGPDAGKVPAECATNLSDSDRQSVDFTTLIIGPNKEGKHVVYTFFPGPATFKFKEIPIDRIKDQLGYPPETERIVVTVKEAIALGYNYCKNTPDIL